MSVRMTLSRPYLSLKHKHYLLIHCHGDCTIQRGSAIDQGMSDVKLVLNLYLHSSGSLVVLSNNNG